MGITVHFVLGFVTSFLGTLTPSMLNMTTAKISITKSKRDAIKFAVGVSIIVLLQAYIAILFTKFLRNNPMFVQSLQKIAMVIFIALSFYFYKQSKKEKAVSFKEKTGNSFVIGLILSALNMFSIPFYCGVTTALDAAGWFQFSQQNILIFVIGSSLGTFTLLDLYANYAKFIELKSKGIAKNLNLILSVLTGSLALFTGLKLWI